MTIRARSLWLRTGCSFSVIRSPWLRDNLPRLYPAGLYPFGREPDGPDEQGR